MIIFQHKSEMNSWNGTQRGQEKGVHFKTFSVNFNISFSMSQWSLGFHFSPLSGCMQTLKAGYIRVWFACHQFWDIVRKRGDWHCGHLITFLFLFSFVFPSIYLSKAVIFQFFENMASHKHMAHLYLYVSKMASVTAVSKIKYTSC